MGSRANRANGRTSAFVTMRFQLIEWDQRMNLQCVPPEGLTVCRHHQIRYEFRVLGPSQGPYSFESVLPSVRAEWEGRLRGRGE